MRQSGKFLLFDLTEFDAWLSGLIVFRKIKRIQNHRAWLPDYPTFQSHLERGSNQIAHFEPF